MYADTNARPGLDEQYIAATNASDLSLDPDRTCAADHLIAAGLIGNRMGAAMKHLRSEWDVAPKPAPWTESDIVARAEIIPKRKNKLDMGRARAQVLNEYATSLRAVYMRLPLRMDALAIMAEWARRRNVDPDLLSPALYHRLHPTCHVCLGRERVKLPDAPVLGKQCVACGGEGKRAKPHDSERVLRWLKACEGKEKGERAAVLHGQVTSDDVTRMAERLRGDDLDAPEPSDEERARVAAHFAASMGKRRVA